MATQTIKTTIKLRYDTLANWTSANPVLAAGEVAVVAIPSESATTVQQVTKPANLFKVGDGSTKFNLLPYTSALAADVYGWAKAATKPSYTKSEVGLGNVLNVASYAKTETYSKTEVDDLISAVEGALEADTNTQYQLVQDGTTLKLQSKELNGTWADVKSFNLYTILQDKFDAAGAAASALTSSKAYTDSELTKKANELQTAIDIESDNVDEILNGTVVVGRAEADFNNKIIHETYATKDELDAVEAKIPTVPVKSVNGKTGAVVLAAADVNTYNKTEIDAKVKANADAIEALTNGASTEEIDSVMELVAYVNEHGVEVKGMKDDISENAGNISTLQGEVNTIKGKPAYNITSTNIADWDGEVGAKALVETKENAGVAASLIGALDVTVTGMGAGKTIKTLTETDGKIAATFQDISIKKSQISDFKDSDYDAAGSASSALASAKSYADGLAKNYDSSGSAAQALVDAKAYADAEDAKIESRVTTLEGKAGLDKVGTVTKVSAGTGLKVTGTATTTPTVEIDTDVIFVLDGGSAAGH